MCIVGQPAPETVCDAVVHGKDFHDAYNLADLKGQYVFLFFYPLDFTFVCPSEIIAFQEKLHEFEQRNCQVIGASIDSKFSHHAWLQQERKKGGIQGVTYPLLADVTKTVSRSFGVLDEEEGIAKRGQFIIDKEGIIRHVLINDLGIGRSVDEGIRLLDALQFTEKHGEVCPANWKPGEKAMKADQQGLEDYFGK